MRYDLDRLQGTAKPRRSCGALMSGVKSFIYTDETRSHMVMFGQAGARGPILGAFNSNEHWCKIVLSDGFFTGWVKRQDDDWVYLRQGC